MHPYSARHETLYLDRPGGRIAYHTEGDGPLVVCVPGMGDVRSVYEDLSVALVGAGFKVAPMDLRGHGESDTTFDAFDDVAAGTDALALVEHLGGTAVLVGNSMGAGAVCWAAAESPAMVSALVLFGPFVRNGQDHPVSQFLFRLALMRPWGPAAWRVYFKSLYPTRRDSAFEEHYEEATERLSEPGRWEAFRRTTHTSHAPVEARLPVVLAPTLVVMGGKDPDFPDPAVEARWIAERLEATVVMVPRAGHYPQAEFPEIVSPQVVAFLNDALGRTGA